MHNGCGNRATLHFLKTMNELLCHAAFDAPLTASGEMMFMPAGSHTITPSQGGKAVKVTVLVTPAGAQELEAQRQALEAKGKRPYFDFNHEDGPASFWPTAFYWKDGPAPGIYCRGEWSESGRTAVEGNRRGQSLLIDILREVDAVYRALCRLLEGEKPPRSSSEPAPVSGQPEIGNPASLARYVGAAKAAEFPDLSPSTLRTIPTGESSLAIGSASTGNTVWRRSGKS